MYRPLSTHLFRFPGFISIIRLVLVSRSCPPPPLPFPRCFPLFVSSLCVFLLVSFLPIYSLPILVCFIAVVSFSSCFFFVCLLLFWLKGSSLFVFVCIVCNKFFVVRPPRELLPFGGGGSIPRFMCPCFFFSFVSSEHDRDVPGL